MPSLKDLYNRGVVEIVDDNTSLGNGFESLRFSGVGVDLTDAGDKTAIVNITGGGGSGGGDPNVGILAHWSFNEANDTPRVDSVSNIELLEVNNPGVSTGILGNAVNFSGTGGKLLRNLNNTILSINNIDWSVSFWLKMVKPADSTGDKPIIFISKDSGATREYHIQYQAGDAWGDGSRGIYLMINGNPLIKLIDSSFIQNNTWQLLTITHDVSTKKVSGYLNTTQRGTGTYTAPTVTGNSDFWIGQTTNLNSATVEIDEVGIWSRILTGADIVEIYNGGNADSYPYTLTEGGGGGGSALTVKNTSGSTVVSNVDTITVSGLLLSDQGNGDITLFSSGGGASEVINLNEKIFSSFAFTEDAGKFLDLTPNGRNLLPVNSITRVDDPTNGDYIDFDNDGYLVEEFTTGEKSTKTLNSDSWTIDLELKFVKPSPVNGNPLANIILARDSASGREFNIRYYNDNNFDVGYYLTLITSSKTFFIQIVDDLDIPEDEWHRLTVIKDERNKQIDVYLNNSLYTTETFSGSSVHSTNINYYVGTSVYNGNSFQFDNLNIRFLNTWNRSLTSLEASSLFSLPEKTFPFSVEEPEPLFTFKNNGTGEGEVYKQTSGSEVQFRKIKSGSNISISQTADEIIINSTGGGSGGGGTTQFNLQEFQNSTTNIGDGNSEDMEITGELSLLLAAIETNVPAMVRLYTSAASRLEDTRAAGDPIVNTIEGLVTEVETTTDDLRIDLSSIVAFINLESPQTRSIYARVFNQSGAEQSVNVKVIGSTVGVAIPGTRKGDMLVHNGVQYQVQEVGIDGFKLVADSTSATGVRWVEDTGGFSPPGDSKGDILVYDGNEYVKIPIGVSGQGLQVDLNEPAGVKWANFKTGGGGIGDTFIPTKFLGASSLGISLWLDVDPFANQKTIIEVDYRFKTVNLNTTITDQDIITEVTQLNSN